jgi:hypothetical protein
MSDHPRYSILNAIRRTWQFQKENIGNGTAELIARARALVTGGLPVVERDLGMPKGHCSVRYGVPITTGSSATQSASTEVMIGSLPPAPRDEAIAQATNIQQRSPSHKPIVRCQP